jgi:DNA-binding GntR family transcriptional regulator
LTQDEMATLIGASRQTVSEVLRDLVAAGLVERQGRELVLRDVPGLQRLAQLTDP